MGYGCSKIQQQILTLKHVAMSIEEENELVLFSAKFRFHFELENRAAQCDFFFSLFGLTFGLYVSCRRFLTSLGVKAGYLHDAESSSLKPKKKVRTF
jgi:hypothetical protein